MKTKPETTQPAGTQRKSSRKSASECTVIQLMEQICENTEGNGEDFITTESEPYAVELGERLGITAMHATFIAVMANMCDEYCIRLHDIAKHFGVSTIRVVDEMEVLNELVGMRVIVRRREKDGDGNFSIPMNVLVGLKDGRLPEPVQMENLEVNDFIDLVFEFLDQRKWEQCSDEELFAAMEYVMEVNAHLSLVRQLGQMGVEGSSLVLFMVMLMNFMEEHDDSQNKMDIDDYFENRECLRIVRQLENGEHELMQLGLVEYACDEGQIVPYHWRLTDHAKNDVLAELGLPVSSAVTGDVRKYEDITEKKLYFNKDVTRQVERLEEVLDQKRMDRILRGMETHGMRRGFACLFYGAPGTGKTETVLQLARRCKRDIMVVDVPGIRSKWVGETEQNIKALFDRYRTAVKKSKVAPILLFNEADALLNRRNEGGVNAIDKMENAMQNIILQEMETLEGIMIATTNLTGSLDDAFERRFLYKIEFEKPTPEERKHIWQSMLPDLKESQASALANRFDFSGGQIENIARKRIVDDIIDCRIGIDLKSLIENCEHERIRHKSGTRVGF